MSVRIEVGQQYRCKRRGHVLTVTWSSAAINRVEVKSSSGKLYNMRLDRLLTPYRFEQVVEPAKITPERSEGESFRTEPAEETPAQQEPAHAP